jgi:glycosyltransferase involved in cell wall biosynthesis
MDRLDIIIPVYNEGENIVEVLRSLEKRVKTAFRVLICYDDDNDNTLPAVKSVAGGLSFETVLVKNKGRGAHKAVTTGFAFSDAAAVLVFPADDMDNFGIIDGMYEKFKLGNDIVSASRFMKGGCMKGCPWLKAFLVRSASFTLHTLAGIPVRDATNGSRLFSKRVLESIPIESDQGFTYSLELLVKCHRLKWRISEVPSSWFRRKIGKSHFRLFKWLPHYMRWYLYAFSTRYLGRLPQSVAIKPCPVKENL